MKKAIFSFDYELFFGDRSGTVIKTLIEPTNLMLDQMDRFGLKGNFFVDYLMLKYLSENKDQRSHDDLVMIKKQLQDIIRRGHRIELHIHPHWVNAKYKGDGTWDFSDFSHYSLCTFSEEEIVSMFKEGIQILYEVIHEVDSDYRIVAFRAGGWAVQPFSMLKKAFLEADILIDSSTSYGIKNINKDSQYDFTHIPRRSAYRFEDEVEKESMGGTFLEVPISSYYRFLFYKLSDRIFKFLDRKNMVKYADGTHYRAADTGFPSSGVGFFHRSMYNTTCVSVLSAVMATFFSGCDLIVYIDHPKDFMMATLTSMKYISKMVKAITYKDLLV